MAWYPCSPLRATRAGGGAGNGVGFLHLGQILLLQLGHSYILWFLSYLSAEQPGQGCSVPHFSRSLFPQPKMHVSMPGALLTLTGVHE